MEAPRWLRRVWNFCLKMKCKMLNEIWCENIIFWNKLLCAFTIRPRKDLHLCTVACRLCTWLRKVWPEMLGGVGSWVRRLLSILMCLVSFVEVIAVNIHLKHSTSIQRHKQIWKATPTPQHWSQWHLPSTPTKCPALVTTFEENHTDQWHWTHTRHAHTGRLTLHGSSNSIPTSSSPVMQHRCFASLSICLIFSLGICLGHFFFLLF